MKIIKIYDIIYVTKVKKGKMRSMDRKTLIDALVESGVSPEEIALEMKRAQDAKQKADSNKRKIEGAKAKAAAATADYLLVLGLKLDRDELIQSMSEALDDLGKRFRAPKVSFEEFMKMMGVE